MYHRNRFALTGSELMPHRPHLQLPICTGTPGPDDWCVDLLPRFAGCEEAALYSVAASAPSIIVPSSEPRRCFRFGCIF
jgi:hypothetical protein